MKKILLLSIVLTQISFSALNYEDVSQEHWAYSAISNLVKKGIVEDNQNFFNGSRPVTRYEFAYYLSKLLNKTDLEKANKKELETLESLIYDFSKELNKFGFDTGTYNERLRGSQDSINYLNKKLEEQGIIMEEVIRRIELLERKSK